MKKLLVWAALTSACGVHTSWSMETDPSEDMFAALEQECSLSQTEGDQNESKPSLYSVKNLLCQSVKEKIAVSPNEQHIAILTQKMLYKVARKGFISTSLANKLGYRDIMFSQNSDYLIAAYKQEEQPLYDYYPTAQTYRKTSRKPAGLTLDPNRQRQKTGLAATEVEYASEVPANTNVVLYGSDFCIAEDITVDETGTQNSTISFFDFSKLIAKIKKEKEDKKRRAKRDNIIKNGYQLG